MRALLRALRPRFLQTCLYCWTFIASGRCRGWTCVICPLLIVRMMISHDKQRSKFIICYGFLNRNGRNCPHFCVSMRAALGKWSPYMRGLCYIIQYTSVAFEFGLVCNITVMRLLLHAKFTLTLYSYKLNSSLSVIIPIISGDIGRISISTEIWNCSGWLEQPWQMQRL